VANTGKDSHFVESILLFLIGEISEFDTLQRILAIVYESLDFIDARVSTLAQFHKYLKFFKGHKLRQVMLYYFVDNWLLESQPKEKKIIEVKCSEKPGITLEYARRRLFEYLLSPTTSQTNWLY